MLHIIKMVTTYLSELYALMVNSPLSNSAQEPK